MLAEATCQEQVEEKGPSRCSSLTVRQCFALVYLEDKIPLDEECLLLTLVMGSERATTYDLDAHNGWPTESCTDVSTNKTINFFEALMTVPKNGDAPK